MALARVVSFDGVTADAIREMEGEMRDSEPPEGLPAKEIVVLHDPDAEKSLVISPRERRGRPAGRRDVERHATGDTPGQRGGVAKSHVAIRMTA